MEKHFSPEEMQQYFEKNGWSEKPCVHRNMRIFQRGDDRTAIPASFAVKGYDNAILDVVNYVAAIENKTAVEIVADIENAVSKNPQKNAAISKEMHMLHHASRVFTAISNDIFVKIQHTFAACAINFRMFTSVRFDISFYSFGRVTSLFTDKEKMFENAIATMQATGYEIQDNNQVGMDLLDTDKNRELLERDLAEMGINVVEIVSRHRHIARCPRIITEVRCRVVPHGVITQQFEQHHTLKARDNHDINSFLQIQKALSSFEIELQEHCEKNNLCCTDFMLTARGCEFAIRPNPCINENTTETCYTLGATYDKENGQLQFSASPSSLELLTVCIRGYIPNAEIKEYCVDGKGFLKSVQFCAEQNQNQ